MPQQRYIGLAIGHNFAYYRDVLRAISKWAQFRPDWSFVALNPEFDRSTFESLKHVDAVIVSIYRADLHERLPRHLALVDVGNLFPHIAGLRVTTDCTAAAQMAAHHFLQRGLRSIGFVGQRQYSFSAEKELALRSAASEAGCEFQSLNFHTQEQDNHDVSPLSFRQFPNTALGDWLLALPRPTGVFAPCDLWGIEILQACQDVGLRVPEDIAVLGVDDDELCCLMARPPMSSVILPTEAIGRTAAESIESQLSKRVRRSFAARQILLPPVGIATRRSTDLVAIDDPDLVAAVRFIRENCHRPISVADVVQGVAVSRRGLERRMRDTLNSSISSEICKAKLAFTKRMLIQTDYSIAQIADHCGYSDLRRIEYVFQKELGISPSQFRKQARQSR